MKDQWIKVSEALPEKKKWGVRVIAYWSNPDPGNEGKRSHNVNVMNFLSDGTFSNRWGGNAFPVTHWMPMPKKPKP